MTHMALNCTVQTLHMKHNSKHVNLLYRTQCADDYSASWIAVDNTHTHTWTMWNCSHITTGIVRVSHYGQSHD